MTTIRQLHPGDEDALTSFLLAHLDSSMFLLSNLRQAGLIDNHERYSGTYIAAFTEGEIVAVVAHYWNGNLLCQAPIHVEALCHQAINVSGRRLAGIVGPGTQVKTLCQHLAIDAHHCQMADAEGLYTLPLTKLIRPAALHEGHVRGRLITADDIDELAHWRAAYNHEALGDPDSAEGLAQAQHEINRAAAEGLCWVLEADGQRVAMSSFNATLPEAVQVGGVYTPPQWRGRGYARAVVAASLHEAWAAGAQRAMLFTDDENIAAQRAYRALGFERVADWGLVLLKEPMAVDGEAK